MEGFLNNLASDIGVTDIIDILIVAFVAYKILGFIRESRAEQLVKGLLVLVAAFFLSDCFQLHTLNWILKGTMTVGIIALIVVFQPELRRGLEYMGRSKIIKPVFGKVDKVKAKMIVTEFAEALETMSTDKTGALIVIERETALEDICETGTIINADISAELIVNLFYEGSPLHDGAVIVRGDKLYSAGCVLPLTQNKNLSKDLGTRHRAGIGITENSDALVLVVSEETGIISIAEDGKLDRFLDIKTVEKILLSVYINKGNDKPVSGIKSTIKKLGRKKDVSE